LKRAGEDPNPAVRVEALRAVRPWSRQGHLFFLDRALRSSSPRVAAEALVNLSRISWRELPPEILNRTRLLAGRSATPQVQLRAFEAFKSWDRLEWPMLRDVLTDPEAPEALRVTAVALSKSLPENEDRGELLLDILVGAPSPRLAWKAYRELRESAEHEDQLPPASARFLTESGERNAATEEIATFLRDRGYRVEYRAGAWTVSRR
jgi:hypothetical protein